MDFRPLIHLLLHFAVPAVVAKLAWPRQFLKSFLTMSATMLVDLDHLLADPVYDPDRCSIGYHPLHQYPMIALYTLALWWPRTRLICIGLLIHMFLDGMDCIWMHYEN
jgi:hypothetical protein